MYALQLFRCIDILSLYLFYNAHKKQIYVRKWSSNKMYIKKKKQSRSFGLMSATPSRRFCLCSALLLTCVGGAAMTLVFSSRARFTCGGSSGVTVTPVSVISLGMFLLLLFQGVSPVILSYCWRITRSSLALKMGSVNWSSFGLVYAGGSPLPHPPCPRPGCPIRLDVLAHNHRPRDGTIPNKTVGFRFDQYFIADGMWCFLQRMLVRRGWYPVRHESRLCLATDQLLGQVPLFSDSVLWLVVKVL